MIVIEKKRMVGILVAVLLYTIMLLLSLSFCTPTETVEEPVVAVAQEPEVEAPILVVEEPSPVVEPEPTFPSELPEEPIIEAAPPVEEKVEVVQQEPAPVAQPVVVEEPVVMEQPVPLVMEAPPPVVETPVVEEPRVMEPEEDPFADFYVAGEEDYSIFVDGTYLVPLFVNSEYLADINVTFSMDTLLVDVAEFRSVISELLIDSVETQLFTTDETRFSLEYLNSQGIEAWYDYTTFELYMNFPTWMMPTRVLSINRGSITRYSTYSMTGSTFLEPEPFSWYTNLSLYSLIDVSKANSWEINPSSLFTMQSRNSFSIRDVGFDFSYTLHPGRAYNKTNVDPWSDDFGDYLTFQGIQGFYDYKPKSLRFTFGNVNDYLGYSTDAIGIALEKRYAYGDVEAKGHQYEYEVVVEEPAIVEVLINEKSVYRRELQPGIYRLRDFIFSQGANYARVVVEPIADPTRKLEYEFVLGYDSRLLSRGDTLYSAALSFPDYNIGKTIFRLNQQMGLTDEITSSYSLAFSPSALNVGLSGLVATPFGSFDLSLTSSYNAPLGLGFTGMLGYRIAGKEDSPFGSLSVSTGFSSSNYSSSMEISPTAVAVGGHSIDTSISFSGRVGERFRYTLGGTLNWNTNEAAPYWRINVGTGIPLIPRMSLSGSVSMYATPTDPVPLVRGQIGLNYSFTPDLSMAASTNLQDSTNLNASWRPFGSTNDNMQFSLSGIRFDDPLDHQGSISYSHSADAYGISLRQQFDDRYERFSTSISLNTALAYADGMLGITRSIADNFLLVRPGGSLKGSKIAVTRTMTTEPTALPSLFGVGTYTGITTHQENNVVAYGIGDSIMGTSESFIFDFLPRPRQGYAVRISSEPTYSLVGTLLRTPTSAYSRYTTDLARVEVAENGEVELVLDETLYLFTDENGFFFISGIKAGEYQFSIFLPNSEEDDPPIDVRFVVEELEDGDGPIVLMLEDFVASDIADALEIEAYEAMMGTPVENGVLDENGHYRLEIVDSMDEIMFWNEWYPSRQVFDATTAVETTTDSYLEFVDLAPETESALSRLRREQEQRLFNLARLRAIVKPYLDAVMPKEGWVPEQR